MSWTSAVVWEKEHPELYKALSARGDNGVSDTLRRIYSHGSLGSDAANQRYMQSLEKDIPLFEGKTYGDVLKEDLRLMKMALAKQDRCMQFIDCNMAQISSYFASIQSGCSVPAI
jgi:hypothetical protein